MEEITFLVQGSSEEPYTVTFVKEGNNLTSSCTCPAGIWGLHCKHRVNILSGSPKGIVSDNESDVETVAFSWLPGTDVEQALIELKQAEKMFEKAKKTLNIKKKKLAKAMTD